MESRHRGRTRTDFLQPVRKMVILVDHNELSQAVDGIEEAEILEIIDHHRVGDISTTAPIYVYNDPVGSTCTVVAGIMFLYQTRIPKELHRRLKLYCVTHDIALMHFVVEAIEEKLGRKVKPKKGPA